MIKNTIKKSVKVSIKGKSKVLKAEVKNKSAYIPKDFEAIKKLVSKLQRKDFDKIVKACKEEPSQDIRLQRESSSGIKLLNMFYSNTFKSLRGKEAEVLKFSKGILHTLNASDRKLLAVLNLLTGSDKIDVIKFYQVGDKKSHRKALVIRITK